MVLKKLKRDGGGVERERERERDDDMRIEAETVRVARMKTGRAHVCPSRLAVT